MENKLSWVSARFTPSNVVLTSLVSLNCSSTFQVALDFLVAAVGLLISIKVLCLIPNADGWIFNSLLKTTLWLWLTSVICVPFGIWFSFILEYWVEAAPIAVLLLSLLRLSLNLSPNP